MIEVNGQKYDATKMAPRVQFHVLRRLSPLLTSIGGAAMGLLDDDKPKAEVYAEIAAAIGPLTETLSMMPDEQLDYVLDACLAHINRLDIDQKWHPAYVAMTRGGLTRMYQDIDAGAELRLAGEVLRVNLAGFFAPLSGAIASSPSAPGVAPQAPT